MISNVISIVFSSGCMAITHVLLSCHDIFLVGLVLNNKVKYYVQVHLQTCQAENYKICRQHIMSLYKI